MLRGHALTALVALTFACKPGGCGAAARGRSDADKVASGDETSETKNKPGPASTGQIVRAAGIELTVPDDWLVLDEDEPNFALAYGIVDRPPHIPVCTVELRRQGPGPLPDGARESSEGGGVFEYQRGALHGLFRLFPGPDGSSIIAHCRAPRSRQWAAVKDLFAPTRSAKRSAQLTTRRASPKPEAIVELCRGTPARMTLVCARRADGAVFCGATTGEVLNRIALPSPAVQISCAGRYGCARDGKGAVMCWQNTETPTVVAGIEARDIAGGAIVDTAGKLLRRQRSGFKEVAPLDDPTLALTAVERVLEGSHDASGCVLRQGSLWCWDDGDELPITLTGGGGPQIVAPAPGASDLRRMGDRLCVETNGRWMCIDGNGQRFEFDSCEARPCGCSPVGASRLSCEDEPYQRISSRPLGRVSNVVAVADPCAALTDGTVVCRGPVAGTKGPKDTGATQSITDGLPGITHVLELR